MELPFMIASLCFATFIKAWVQRNREIDLEPQVFCSAKKGGILSSQSFYSQENAHKTHTCSFANVILLIVYILNEKKAFFTFNKILIVCVGLRVINTNKLHTVRNRVSIFFITMEKGKFIWKEKVNLFEKMLSLIEENCRAWLEKTSNIFMYSSHTELKLVLCTLYLAVQKRMIV